MTLAFWLGTHEPSWLRRTDVPLFVSTRRLQRLRRLPSAVGPWALDSGGFTELSMFGEWQTSPAQYAAHVRRYAAEVGETYLDYHSAMVDARGGLPVELSADGVHPNEAGYRVMAPLAEAAIAQALVRRP